MSERRGKYNARRSGQFDSLAEERRYHELMLLEKAGDIIGLTVHPVFEIFQAFTDGTGKKHRGIRYEADFQYTEGGRVIVEDVKGVETEVFKIKRKLFVFQMRDFGVDEFRTVKP